MMLFSLAGVRKVYGDRTVLDIPAMEIPSGQIIGLTGPNGSGKTTLLNLLAMLEAPTAGEVRYAGQPVDFRDPKLHRHRREVVLVDQHPIMFSRTVLGNVAYGLAIRKTPRHRRQERVMACLEKVGLAHLATARADRLSGGETQRAAIARALACAPRVLLFDEPTANVDAANRVIIEKIIRECHAHDRISIMMTSHDDDQVSRLCHTAIALHDGRIGEGGTENLLRGQTEQDGQGHVCRVSDRLRFPIPIPAPAVADMVTIAVDGAQLMICETHEVSPQPGDFVGRVVRMAEANGGIKIVVDVGVPLVLLQPRERALQMRLGIGLQVGVRCPPSAVRLI